MKGLNGGRINIGWYADMLGTPAVRLTGDAYSLL